MRTILAIDPGPNETAFLLWNGSVQRKGFLFNKVFLEGLRNDNGENEFGGDLIAIEMVACYGMPVGKEVFETVVQIGRIMEILRRENVVRVFRKQIVMHLCGSALANDSNVRQALIDRIGPKGKKKSPGPTYGLAKHDWSALAIAVYAQDTLI